MVWFALVVLSFGRSVWRSWRQDEQFRGLAGLTALMLAVGTVFYATVEGWGLFDALYFSVITLSTVGYGDLTPKTTFARAFTMVYILCGLGILVGFLNTFAEDRLRRHAGPQRWRGALAGVRPPKLHHAAGSTPSTTSDDDPRHGRGPNGRRRSAGRPARRRHGRVAARQAARDE
jgi:hypothetical protein